MDRSFPPSAAERIWAENESFIRRLCAYKLSSHPDRVEDTVQEVGLAFFAALRKGTEIREPKRWLTAVAANKIRDAYREMAAEAKVFVPAADEALQAVPAPSETEPLSEKETARVCKAFFASLTPEERRLFRLRFQKRLKHREIAAQLGISEGAVKVRVFRLREKAKALIRAWTEENM